MQLCGQDHGSGQGRSLSPVLMSNSSAKGKCSVNFLTGSSTATNAQAVIYAV